MSTPKASNINAPPNSSQKNVQYLVRPAFGKGEPKSKLEDERTTLNLVHSVG